MNQIDLNSEYLIEDGHIEYYGLSPHIIIPEGIQEIKSFSDVYPLLSVVVPEGVKIINDEVFGGLYGCAIYLEYIKLPGSLIEIHKESFPFWRMAVDRKSVIECPTSTKNLILEAMENEHTGDSLERWGKFKEGLKWIIN